MRLCIIVASLVQLNYTKQQCHTHTHTRTQTQMLSFLVKRMCESWGAIIIAQNDASSKCKSYFLITIDHTTLHTKKMIANKIYYSVNWINYYLSSEKRNEERCELILLSKLFRPSKPVGWTVTFLLKKNMWKR